MTRDPGGAGPDGAGQDGAALNGAGQHGPGGGGVRRTVHVIDTPHGPARAHRWTPQAPPAGALVLSHGAGGRDWSADLLALTVLADPETSAAPDRPPWEVVLVEQPWRVAGRKVASPPKQLDAAWLAVLGALRSGPEAIAVPLVAGGRSAGARVACRTAHAVAADGVLALAFPLHPPGKPQSSRAGELAAVAVPLLVVQGGTDPFGTPEEIRAAVPTAPVVAVGGGHGFSKDPGDVVVAVRQWLGERYAR